MNQRIWNIKAREVQILIGALSKPQQPGETPPGDPWQKQDPQLAKTAILGSAHILKKLLDLPESR